ncbi:transcription factor SPT20 homolog [Solanum pennellii]|uniref:Transcription factor SPT20 homolog n=1 Tax=Solanum pennellii TaxID=28526 RepID=A0ABM1HE73_SOLPN|nr:transcription factor SPT20 homolog [Solanum pennellii]
MEVEKSSKEKGAGKGQEQEKGEKEETTKNSNQSNKTQKDGKRKNDEQNQTRAQVTGQQQRKDMQNQDEQRQQEEIQEEQWQTQKKRHQKNQEQVISKSVWRPVNPPVQKANDSQQQEQETSGISILPTKNIFSHLEMQEKQEAQQTEQQGFREAASQKDHPKNGHCADQTANNNPNSLKTPNLQATDGNKNRNLGIDLSLPSPKTPNIIDADVGHTVEAYGGMDGGSKKKTTNLQDGVTKGGNLPHVMHEGLDYDHSNDHRASKNDENSLNQQNQQLQQQTLNIDNFEQPAKGKNVK